MRRLLRHRKQTLANSDEDSNEGDVPDEDDFSQREAQNGSSREF